MFKTYKTKDPLFTSTMLRPWVGIMTLSGQFRAQTVVTIGGTTHIHQVGGGAD